MCGTRETSGENLPTTASRACGVQHIVCTNSMTSLLTTPRPSSLRHRSISIEMKTAATFSAPMPNRVLSRRQVRARASKPITDQSATDFLEYVKKQGVDLSAVQLMSYDGLRGVGTTKPIEPGTTVLEMPFKNALVVTPVSRNTLPQTFCSDACWEGLKQQSMVRMALQLLHEKSLGASSKYAAWIKLLPQSYTTIIHWTDQELAALGYPHAASLREKRAKEVEGYYDTIRSLQPNTPVKKEDFVWALDAVQSRLFSGPYSGRSLAARVQLGGLVLVLAALYTLLGYGTVENALNAVIAVMLFNIVYDQTLSKKITWYAMLPFIDMINHRTGTKAEVSYQYFSDKFTLDVGDTYAMGQQLFITYGDKSNDQLLTFYGFAESSNVNDSYVISAGLNEALKKAAGVDALKGGALDQVVITRRGLTEVSTDKVCSALGLAPGSPQIGSVQKALLENELQRLQTVDKSASSSGTVRDEKAAIATAFRAGKMEILREALKATSGTSSAGAKGFSN